MAFARSRDYTPSMRKVHERWALALAVLSAFGLSVTGCAPTAPAAEVETPSKNVAAPATASAEDIMRLNEALERQGEAGDAQLLDCTLSETLPNFTISWDGDPGVRIFGATVDGRVHNVRP